MNQHGTGQLDKFLADIERKVGKESHKIIEERLKANNFTSRLALKLLSPENVDKIFADSSLPLGSRIILNYELGLIRDQSPLVIKKRKNTSKDKDDPPPQTEPVSRALVLNDFSQIL